MGIQVCSNKGHTVFQRGGNYEIAKNIDKILFDKINVLISAKLDLQHPWMIEFQVCSKEGTCPFSKGDNYEIAKVHWQSF